MLLISPDLIINIYYFRHMIFGLVSIFIVMLIIMANRVDPESTFGCCCKIAFLASYLILTIPGAFYDYVVYARQRLIIQTNIYVHPTPLFTFKSFRFYLISPPNPYTDPVPSLVEKWIQFQAKHPDINSLEWHSKLQEITQKYLHRSSGLQTLKLLFINCTQKPFLLNQTFPVVAANVASNSWAISENCAELKLFLIGLNSTDLSHSLSAMVNSGLFWTLSMFIQNPRIAKTTKHDIIELILFATQSASLPLQENDHLVDSWMMILYHIFEATNPLVNFKGLIDQAALDIFEEIMLFDVPPRVG